MSGPEDVLTDLRHVVLPVVAVHEDGSWTPFGTCFVVAVLRDKTALALTAAHNLQHFDTLDRRSLRHHPTTPKEFLDEGDGAIRLTRTYPKVIVQAQSGGDFAVAEITRGWWSSNNDTAAILLNIPESSQVHFGLGLALDTRPPAPGEAVMVVGYRAMSARFTSEPDYEKPLLAIQMDSEIRSEPGEVVEVCPKGTGMYGFPGFLISSPIHSGMSGGPVMSSGFIVRGIASGDLSESPEQHGAGSGTRAFASALWPTMLVRPDIGLRDPGGTVRVPEKSPLVEWARRGVIDDRGGIHERLGVDPLDEEVRALAKGFGTRIS